MNDFQQQMEDEFMKVALKVFNPPMKVGVRTDTIEIFEMIGYLQLAWRVTDKTPKIQHKIHEAWEISRPQRHMASTRPGGHSALPGLHISDPADHRDSLAHG